MNESIKEFREKGLKKADLDELVSIAMGNERVFRRIAQRRLFKEPMGYIRRSAPFFGRDFYVDRRVYVPNPETEKMVRLALRLMENNSLVFDVGTGCGSIAITLKKENPSLIVTGFDINPSALEVAQENARAHDADVRFFESCYVDDIDFDEPRYIISDMPWGDENYVLGSNDLAEMRHMPPEAIFHPEGILEAYNELIQSIQRKSWKPILFFESGTVEEEHVKKIIPEGVKHNYVDFENYSVTVVDFKSS